MVVKQLYLWILVENEISNNKTRQIHNDQTTDGTVVSPDISMFVFFVRSCRLVDAGIFSYRTKTTIQKQEALEKCWAHLPLRAAARLFTRCRYRYCHTQPAHRCPRRQRRQRRQRQRVTEGTAMAPWNGPNHARSGHFPRKFGWPHSIMVFILYTNFREECSEITGTGFYGPGTLSVT